MSKESFKSFARLHPELVNTILTNKISWQQLYEIYEIYGENNPIWDNYITTSKVDSIASSVSSLKDFINSFKNLDVDSIQQGITNIQKTIGLLQDLNISKEEKPYEAKPIYKRFDD